LIILFSLITIYFVFDLLVKYYSRYDFRLREISLILTLISVSLFIIITILILSTNKKHFISYHQDIIQYKDINIKRNYLLLKDLDGTIYKIRFDEIEYEEGLNDDIILIDYFRCDRPFINGFILMNKNNKKVVRINRKVLDK